MLVEYKENTTKLSDIIQKVVYECAVNLSGLCKNAGSMNSVQKQSNICEYMKLHRNYLLHLLLVVRYSKYAADIVQCQNIACTLQTIQQYYTNSVDNFFRLQFKHTSEKNYDLVSALNVMHYGKLELPEICWIEPTPPLPIDYFFLRFLNNPFHDFQKSLKGNVLELSHPLFKLKLQDSIKECKLLFTNYTPPELLDQLNRISHSLLFDFLFHVYLVYLFNFVKVRHATKQIDANTLLLSDDIECKIDGQRMILKHGENRFCVDRNDYKLNLARKIQRIHNDKQQSELERFVGTFDGGILFLNKALYNDLLLYRHKDAIFYHRNHNSAQPHRLLKSNDLHKSTTQTFERQNRKLDCMSLNRIISKLRDNNVNVAFNGIWIIEKRIFLKLKNDQPVVHIGGFEIESSLEQLINDVKSMERIIAIKDALSSHSVVPHSRHCLYIYANDKKCKLFIQTSHYVLVKENKYYRFRKASDVKKFI